MSTLYTTVITRKTRRSRHLPSSAIFNSQPRTMKFVIEINFHKSISPCLHGECQSKYLFDFTSFASSCWRRGLLKSWSIQASSCSRGTPGWREKNHYSSIRLNGKSGVFDEDEIAIVRVSPGESRRWVLWRKAALRALLSKSSEFIQKAKTLNLEN